MPNAKLSLEYGNQFSRDLPYEAAGHRALAAAGIPYIGLNENSTRLLIAAQWKLIEGGSKIAEIARERYIKVRNSIEYIDVGECFTYNLQRPSTQR